MPYIGNMYYPFIYKGNDLVYPNPIKDGLMVWLDFKSYTNNTRQKQIPVNLANNTKDGRLNNFAYLEGSGYDDGLQFDGVDDFIDIKDMTIDNFLNKEKFTFNFTISFTDSNKRGAIISLPLTFPNDGTRRLLVKVNENKEITIGRYNGVWKGKKSIPINKSKVNVTITFEGMTGDDFDLNIWIDGVPSDVISNGVASSEYYGNPYSNLVIGWQGTNSQGDYAFLKEKIHSLKIYDRILNDQEINYNYTIEKERWGL